MNTVRGMADFMKDFIVTKVEFFNVFNEISRAAIIENIQGKPSLKHLAWFAAVTPYNDLELSYNFWRLSSSEGQTQGDPKAGAIFCIGIQQHVLELFARWGCFPVWFIGLYWNNNSKGCYCSI